MNWEWSRWTVSITVSDHCFGVGWWKGSPKLFEWSRVYYDGWILSVRLGPFFYCRGPY